MLEAGVRQAATVLLDSAIRIAPPLARAWGRAMKGEMDYVQGPWAAGMWALGGTTVLLKETLASLVVPGRRGPGTVGDGGLFARSATVRNAASAMGGACVLAALLFIAAPPFRQAFTVAMRSWSTAFRAPAANSDAEFQALAQRARAQRDAEALAFCALRTSYARQGARIADEAVNLDRSLLWIDAVLPLRDPGLPESAAWLEKLQAFDPQNALLHLLAAEVIAQPVAHETHDFSQSQARFAAWQREMAAAFESPKFDDYSARIVELNRQVVPRYGLSDPYEVQARAPIDLPASIAANSQRYAGELLSKGRAVEAKEARQDVRRRCWTVARFGQMLDSDGRSDSERRLGDSLQAMAYQRLRASATASGDLQEAALFAYLEQNFEAAASAHPESPAESAFGWETAQRNAAVVQFAALMIVVFSGLMLAAVVILLAASRKKARPAMRRAKPVASLVVLTSGVGMLFSSVTLYLTYRPYWYMVRGSILSGGSTSSRDLRDFLVATETPSGASHSLAVLADSLFYAGSPGFLFYFWAGVGLLGVIGLVLILLRHFLGRPPNGENTTRRS